MHGLRTRLIATGFAALALTGCNKTAPTSQEDAAQSLEARLAKLITDNYRIDGADQANIEALIAALPADLSVTYETLALDPSNGATVLGAVKLSHADTAGLGVEIGELKLWALDTDLAIARLSGTRLDETAPLVRHIEATGVALVGLEVFLESYLDAVNNATTSAISGTFDDPDTLSTMQREMQMQMHLQMEMEITDYTYNIDKLVLDEVGLRPFVLVPTSLDPSNPFAEFFPYLQIASAYYSAISVDMLAAFDTTGAMSSSGAHSNSSFEYSMDTVGWESMRGGDYASALALGLDYSSTVTNIQDTGYAGMGGIKLAMTGKRVVQNDMRLDKLMQYVARGEMPARTDTDLLSFGTTRATDMQMFMNDAPAYSIGEISFDMSQFHWLVPTELEFGVENAIYEIGGLVETFETMSANVGNEFYSDEAWTAVHAVLGKLAEYGLDRPSLDAVMRLGWDPDSGVAHVELDYDLDDYVDTRLTLNGTLPDFNSVSALAPENDLESTDEAALEALFQDVAAFSGFELKLIDLGGLEKGFALAIDLSKMDALNPPPEMAFMRNQTPDSLRSVIASGIIVAGGAASPELPFVNELVQSFAEWITDGGTWTLKSAPANPIGSAEVEAMQTLEPQAVFERFNVSAELTAP